MVPGHSSQLGRCGEREFGSPVVTKRRGPFVSETWDLRHISVPTPSRWFQDHRRVLAISSDGLISAFKENLWSVDVDRMAYVSTGFFLLWLSNELKMWKFNIIYIIFSNQTWLAGKSPKQIEVPIVELNMWIVHSRVWLPEGIILDR